MNAKAFLSAARAPRAGARAVLAGLALALVAGCSGGGGDEPAAPPQAPVATDGDIPVTALASTMAYAQYVGAQARDDQRAPLVLGNLPAPVSDSDAPITVQ